MATIQGGKITTEVVTASYGNRTPGELGVLTNLNSPRAGGPGGGSEANLPKPRTPGELGRTGDAGVIGKLKVTGATFSNTGPQLISALRGQSLLTSTIGPGSNSLQESGKPIQQQRAQSKIKSSMKK